MMFAKSLPHIITIQMHSRGDTILYANDGGESAVGYK
jgi:hypothetical protein